MSPVALNGSIADDCFEDDLGLSILGIGVQYPPYRHEPDALNSLANRFYKPSEA